MTSLRSVVRHVIPGEDFSDSTPQTTVSFTYTSRVIAGRSIGAERLSAASVDKPAGATVQGCKPVIGSGCRAEDVLAKSGNAQLDAA